MSLAKKSEELGVGLYWDAVLNHKAAADKKEKVKVVEVDSNGTAYGRAAAMDKR